MVESDQTSESGPCVLAVVHVVVADMPDKGAYGCIDQNGDPVVYADRAVAEGDAEARENAYKVFSAAVASAVAATTTKLAPVT